MFKYVILSILLLLFMVGCATAVTKTTITNPSNEVWVVHSKSDALVKIEQEGVKVEVDNRGKTGFWEGIMQYLLIKPNISLSNMEGR